MCVRLVCAICEEYWLTNYDCDWWQTSSNTTANSTRWTCAKWLNTCTSISVFDWGRNWISAQINSDEKLLFNSFKATEKIYHRDWNAAAICTRKMRRFFSFILLLWTNIGVTASALAQKLGNILNLFFFLQFFLQTKLRTYVECVCLFLYWIGMQVPLLGCDWVWKRSNVCATARTTYYVKHDKSEHSVSFALHLQCLHWAQSVVSHWTRSYRLVQIAAIAFLWIYHLHSRDICVFEKAIGEARSNK